MEVFFMAHCASCNRDLKEGEEFASFASNFGRQRWGAGSVNRRIWMKHESIAFHAREKN
jgi:hypothetical protein